MLVEYFRLFLKAWIYIYNVILMISELLTSVLPCHSSSEAIMNGLNNVGMRTCIRLEKLQSLQLPKRKLSIQ
jgi:hypothetical protein